MLSIPLLRFWLKIKCFMKIKSIVNLFPSDTCAGQNRNKENSSVVQCCIFSMKKKVYTMKKVHMKYFEHGHNQSEVDMSHDPSTN